MAALNGGTPDRAIAKVTASVFGVTSGPLALTATYAPTATYGGSSAAATVAVTTPAPLALPSTALPAATTGSAYRAALTADEVTVSDAALREIAANYTREAGVRQMERLLAKALRKAATRLATACCASRSAPA